jgi:hypothetical protein
MSHDNENASEEGGEFSMGDAVQLREPHRLLEAGTQGRIIGFYARDLPEALLALDDGRQLSVPTAKLERVS